MTLAATAVVGLFTTYAVMIGITLDLDANLSNKRLAGMLAFAAGVPTSSLGLELAFESAHQLHQRGFTIEFAWAFISGGFAAGAVCLIRSLVSWS